MGIVTDINGNSYDTVVIGAQEWTVQNFKCTKLNDGTLIPEVTDSGTWGTTTSPGRCSYNNDPANVATYGFLYNFYAVESGTLAPDGWRVPSLEDWQALITYLGGDSVAGGPLKESGTAHWLTPNTGATNSGGFTGLPGGTRRPTGDSEFVGITRATSYWTSTPWLLSSGTPETCLFYTLAYNSATIQLGAWTPEAHPKGVGNSVRLMRDFETVIKYVDVSDEYYGTVGDGSVEHPLDIHGFIDDIGAAYDLSGEDPVAYPDGEYIYYLRGRISTYHYYQLLIDVGKGTIVRILPWDLELYGPWILWNPRITFQVTSINQTFLEVYGGIFGDEEENYPWIEITPNIGFTSFNNSIRFGCCWFDYSSIEIESGGGSCSVVLNGSLLRSQANDGELNVGYNRPLSCVLNCCYFTYSNSTSYPMMVVDPVNTQFNNCTFENSNTIRVQIWTIDGGYNVYPGVNTTLSTLLNSGCSFGFSPSVAIPIATTMSIANKESFNYHLFSIPDITDPIIKQSWINNGYNTGLFGEPRKGVGAFYFGLLTITRYVDLSQITGNGHAGTEEDMWSIEELSENNHDVVGDEWRVILTNKVDLQNCYSYIDEFGAWPPDKVTIESRDIATYGPAVLYDKFLNEAAYPDGYYVYSSPNNPNASYFYVSNLVAEVELLELYNNHHYSGSETEVRNCFFIINEDGHAVYIHGDVTWTYYGCSFSPTRVCRLAPYGPLINAFDIDPVEDGWPGPVVWLYVDTDYWGSEPTKINFYDCVFNTNPLNILSEYHGQHSVNVNFYNCKFRLDKTTFTSVIDNITYDWAGRCTLTFDDKCEFSFDFGTDYFTEGDLIDVSNKTAISYSNFNIPDETDPTILQRWIDNNYNSGLFGEPRLGIGAFYFGSTPTPEPSGPPENSGLILRGIKPILTNKSRYPYKISGDIVVSRVDVLKNERLSYLGGLPVEFWMNISGTWSKYEDTVTDRFGSCYIAHPTENMSGITNCLGIARITYNNGYYVSNVMRYNFYSDYRDVIIDATPTGLALTRTNHDIFDGNGRAEYFDRMY